MIKETTGLDTELIVGGRGEFTVWVGDDRVAQKSSQGFPTEEEIVAAVKKALAN